MVKYCTKCGAEVNDKAKFCGKCGAKLSENNESTQSTQSTQSIQSKQSTQNTQSTQNIQSTQNTAINSSSQETRYVEDNTITEMFLNRSGRLNRLRYFKRTIALNVFWIVMILLGTAVLLEEWEYTSTPYEVYCVVLGLAKLFPEYCLNVRRLHDLDNEDLFIAKWIAAMDALTIFLSATGDDFMESSKGIVMLFLYLIFTLYLLFARGTKGDNRFGADPTV